MSGAVSARLVVALAVLALVLGGTALWWRSARPTDVLQQATSVLDDRSRHGTAMAAGDALAEISGMLLDEARRCQRSGDGQRCDATAQVAAFAQALAVRVLDCTAPGRFEARRVLREHLAAIDAMGPRDPAPPLPAVPTC